MRYQVPDLPPSERTCPFKHPILPPWVLTRRPVPLRCIFLQLLKNCWMRANQRRSFQRAASGGGVICIFSPALIRLRRPLILRLSAITRRRQDSVSSKHIKATAVVGATGLECSPRNVAVITGKRVLSPISQLFTAKNVVFGRRATVLTSSVIGEL